jgi:hypothetical protein
VHTGHFECAVCQFLVKCAQYAQSAQSARVCTECSWQRVHTVCTEQPQSAQKTFTLRVQRQLFQTNRLRVHTDFLCTPRHFCALLIAFSKQYARFAISTLCTLRYHLAHCAHCVHYCFSHWFLETRRRKTAGNIADELLCCLWHRAEKPEKMTHHLAGGGNNNTG